MSKLKNFQILWTKNFKLSIIPNHLIFGNTFNLPHVNQVWKKFHCHFFYLKNWFPVNISSVNVPTRITMNMNEFHKYFTNTENILLRILIYGIVKRKTTSSSLCVVFVCIWVKKDEQRRWQKTDIFRNSNCRLRNSWFSNCYMNYE